MPGGRLQRDVGNDPLGLPLMPPRMLPAWLLWNPALVISSRFRCRAASPYLEAVANFTLFTVPMLISAWRYRHPDGRRPVRRGLAYAVSHYRHFLRQWSRPFFRPRISSSRRRFYPGPTEEGVLLNLIPVFDGQRNIAHLQPAAGGMTMPNPCGKVFLAIAWPLLRASRFRAQKNDRRRDSRADHTLLVGAIGGPDGTDLIALQFRETIENNQQTDTGPGGNAFEDAGEDFDLIRLATPWCNARYPGDDDRGRAAGQLGQRMPGGTPSTMQPSARP